MVMMTKMMKIWFSFPPPQQHPNYYNPALKVVLLPQKMNNEETKNCSKYVRNVDRPSRPGRRWGGKPMMVGDSRTDLCILLLSNGLSSFSHKVGFMPKFSFSSNTKCSTGHRQGQGQGHEQEQEQELMTQNDFRIF